ncbi:hypothetical protein DSUL_50242 [Desulfovibrionales bacterium]
MNSIKRQFARTELKIIIETHKNMKLLPNQARLAYLQLSLQNQLRSSD